MGGTQASAAPDHAVGEADRRALTELLAEHVTGRPLAQLEADHRVGPTFDRRLLQEAVTAVLAAGWRPPMPTLTTVNELDACRPGAVVTDRDGEPWTRNAAGEWCQAERAGIDPGELLEWAPLTRHTDGAARPAPGQPPP